jgi:hypothetical protein
MNQRSVGFLLSITIAAVTTLHAQSFYPLQVGNRRKT